MFRDSRKAQWITKQIVESNNTYPTDIATKPSFSPVLVLLPSDTDFDKLKNEKPRT